MRRYVALRETPFAIVIAIAALGFPTIGTAAAQGSAHNGRHRLGNEVANPVKLHHRPVAHREQAPAFVQRMPVYRAFPSIDYSRHGQSYIYVPGKGIIDEACNLPTSACPNEMRDIQ